MAPSEENPFRVHEDAPLFREALNYTAAETSFSATLIEKDYYCTLLLRHLGKVEPELVFKGGTCLAKIHAGFYRLSEDLDFAISTPEDATRAERRRRISRLKESLPALEQQEPAFHIVEPIRGSNNSTQYITVIEYHSMARSEGGTIKVEVALREPLLIPREEGPAHTLLRDPVSGDAMIPAIRVPCISVLEAMAEKFRAALTRREVAIRDFYDIDYAVRKLGLEPQHEATINLVRKKLAVARNEPMDVSPDRMASLRPQLAAQLRPVLRSRDFAEFDLDRAISIVSGVAAVIQAS